MNHIYDRLKHISFMLYSIGQPSVLAKWLSRNT